MTRCKAAFTLLEAAFSTVLVGGLVVVALDTLGASVVARQAMTDATAGKMLATSLMSEILRQNFEDPDEPPVFGLESLENALDRLTFDDVDDYRNWSVSPPKYRDGSVIPGYADWTLSVAVVRVDPSDLTRQTLSDGGAKRIDVTVTRGGVEVARLSAVRTGNPKGAPLANG